MARRLALLMLGCCVFGTWTMAQARLSPVIQSDTMVIHDEGEAVQDINGRNRSYLLTAWYKHTFQFGKTNLLGVTGGIIDSTDYLDENAYSNDEFTQFINAALVNAPNAFIPSYDMGGAVEWEYGPLAAKGVIMRIGENDDANAYTFYGTQVGYNLSTPLGEGNYRITFNFSSKDFLDSSGTSEEARRCLLLSFDQQLGENLGAWIRFGAQDDSAAINFKAIYSGGINISGRLWGRKNDNIGIGYAHLKGGNMEFDRTHVAEAYARFALTRILALTLDVQYEDDKYVSSAGQGPNGWTYGARLVAEF